MKWRFTLLDRNNAPTVIDEPEGWDGTEIVLKRDPDMHGMLFDYQGNDFKFSGDAGRLIRKEYERAGLAGEMSLMIEEGCDDGPFDELYTGRLLFARFEALYGDECNVKIPIETTGEVMKLRNKMDQKVDLLATTSFDGLTALPSYARLGFPLKLPSKGVPVRDWGINDAANGTPVAQPTDDLEFDSAYGMIAVPFNVTKASEIGSFIPETQPLYEQVDHFDPGAGPTINMGTGPRESYVWPLYLSPAINFSEGTPNYGAIANPCDLSFRVAGTLETGSPTGYNDIYVVCCVLPEGKTGEALSDYRIIQRTQLLSYNTLTPPYPITVLPFDVAFSGGIDLAKGDRLYVFLALKTDYDFTVTFSADTFIDLYNLSKTAPTDAKVFMINEALSRISEAITDGEVRAYSQYFGRTDSEPYAVASDGAGSRAAITKGLFIRQLETRNGVTVGLPISLKDMWEGLDPIHHLGFGIEKDPYRAGKNCLRVEPWYFFYKSGIVLSCDGVNEIRRKVVEAEHYSTFRFGYEKWEAEQYTGLDEFLTKRHYRTTLDQVKGELSKLSKFVASGYALEITRRMSTESKDWRFDNDTFIISMGPRGGADSTLVFIGEFVDSGDIYVTQMSPADPAPVAADYEVGDVIQIGGTASNNGNFTILTSAQVNATTVHFRVAEPVANEALAIGTEVTPVSGSIYHAETGRVLSPSNIIDPSSVYNFRITPARCALRWLDKILASYWRFTAGSRIIFMDGDGNCQAKGELDSTFAKLENQPLQEDSAISNQVCANAATARPLLRAERHEFDYPMTAKEFRKLRRNPYGKIRYGNENIASVGWIDEMKYKPEEGMASFSIIPAYTISATDLQFIYGLLTEDGQNFIDTEDNQTITTE